MTAVLPPSDPLRKENIMASLDDDHINYSSPSVTDWKTKYYEAADMLAETKNELDDFHQTEKTQQELKVKVERAENERDTWKSKFMSLQTNHNATTASLQRELDSLRQENQKIKIQLRELEMGNDDLERNERAVASSLSDVEAKYARALEEKILLEHELLDKAHLEEECQRVKDELRDSNTEITVLRDQLAAAQTRALKQPLDSVSPLTPPEDPSVVPHTSKSLEEDLLHTQPPPDLEIPDFASESESPPSVPEAPRPSTSSADSESGQSALLQRAGFLPRHKITSPQTPTFMSRSTTLPSLPTPSRIPPRAAVNRSTSHATTSSTAPATANSATTTISRSRGVQMVSEMRAKVKNLEQKIHTRVPRLRMGSTSRPNPPVTALPTSISKSTGLSSGGSVQSMHFKSPDERSRSSLPSRHNAENDDSKRTPAGNSSGWVLIMEDSPSPTKPKDREHRRTSSPPSATGFHAFASLASSSQSFSLSTPDVPSQSVQPFGLRRPQSRLSTSTEGRSSVSTTATVSSIPTPISRPATPTFIPLPSAGLYAHSSTAGATGLKRPSGPSFSGPYFKRSSLGSTTGDSPTNASFLSDSGIPHRELSSSASRTTTSSTPPSHKELLNGNSASQTPHSNVTIRGHSKLPTPTASSSLSQSRIGRPSFGMSGRRSAGGDLSDVEGRFLDARDKGRPRSGSGRN
ncbi:hypothetical protein B0F90DRAFT_1677014 [Multifurca ochricompacta]|uniref:NUDE domain-containing protein n=1 Tax=Multifurca ochricompacta TaxID=376703 RepID=A0AAD4QRN9_9AGAM|nr:hypothetical protein B0F90DRAFT_1677014 [Multifurca ochricompacta]